MTRQNIKTISVLLALFALMLGACRSNAETPAPQEDAPFVTLTPRPDSEATETATPEPIASPTSTVTPTPSPSATPQPVGPFGYPANINPLTGLFVGDSSILERNPVLVKVSNFPRSARPHAGLSSADMVFEYTIGEGGTRFTALFYGQNAPEVGSVRSARLIDASLGNAYQGILAFASADPFVYGRIIDALGQRAITEGPGTCPALCRTGSGDVNSVFADTSLMTDYAAEDRNIVPEKPFLEGMFFDPQAPETGSLAGNRVTVRYSSAAISDWRYDDASGRYLRWIDDVDAANNIELVELVDRVNGEQLAFANVVVLFAEHTELKPTLHEIEILGNTLGRRAILFRDGQAYDVVWRSAGNQPIQFFYPDGSPVPFKPGNTWFEVVGVNSPVSELSPGEWEVQFRIP